MYPSYLNADKSANLNNIIEQLEKLSRSCSLCPRKCGVNRLKDQVGFCKTGYRARIYSAMPHSGEEPPISGKRGSGTIFFAGCNMNCVYCQNYKFSQLGDGKEVTPQGLAEIMIELQRAGCHNINLVTPTHVIFQILKALPLAIAKGLKLPLVYNTSGYESPEIIRLLNGIVDIFLVDMRYSKQAAALKYSNAPDYPKYNQATLEQMQQQIPIAEIDKTGLMRRGIIVRHLVLPNNISGTKEIMQFIAKKISVHTYISLMSQYLPCYTASKFPKLSRRLSEQEYTLAQNAMEKYGLHNGWTQEGRGLKRLAGINIKSLNKRVR